MKGIIKAGIVNILISSLLLLTVIINYGCHSTQTVVKQEPVKRIVTQPSENFRLPDEEESGASNIPKPEICETEDSLSHNPVNPPTLVPADSLPHQ